VSKLFVLLDVLCHILEPPVKIAVYQNCPTGTFSVAGSSVCSLDRVEHLGTLNVSHVLLTLMKLWYSGPYRIGRFPDCDWEKGIFTCQGKLVYGSAISSD